MSPPQKNVNNLCHYKTLTWQMSYKDETVHKCRESKCTFCNHKQEEKIHNYINEEGIKDEEDSSQENGEKDIKNPAPCSCNLTKGEIKKEQSYKEYLKLLQLAKSKPSDYSIPNIVFINKRTLKKFCAYKRHRKSQPFSAAQARRSIIKTEVQQVILVPNTTYLIFRNFQLNKLYKKTVTLQNVSNAPAKFRIDSRPSRSKFMVVIKPIKGRCNIVPAGMQLQLIIYFRSYAVDETDERLLIHVQHGKSVLIRLHGCRDPPILKVEHLEKIVEVLPSLPNEKLSISSDSWRSHSDHTLTSQQSTSDGCSTSILKTVDARRRMYANVNFDCGKCFIGEETEVFMKIHNVGYKGKFFIMSDIDWCSMNIKDFGDRNNLVIPPFEVRPAYFSLNADEEIYMGISFSPDLFGMHVSKLYILCDNGSLITTEVIGDGLMFESSYIEIDRALKIQEFSGIYEDKDTSYQLNLGTGVKNRIISREILINNISEISMYFRWEKRNFENSDSDRNEVYEFPSEMLSVYPEHGIFHPCTAHRFNISADLANLEPNQYFTFLELYIEDIPMEALKNEPGIRTKPCNTKRRSCLTSLDVCITEIEVCLQCIDEDEIFEETNCIYIPEEENKDAFSIISSIDSSSDSAEQMDSVATDSNIYNDNQILELEVDEIFSNTDTVHLIQLGSVASKYIITAGLMKISKVLYIGVKESFTLTLTNKSSNVVYYEWGRPRGLDAHKLLFYLNPVKGRIFPNCKEIVEITFLPLTEGEVRSLSVPCCFGNTENLLILGIECFVQLFHVTFVFPTNKIENLEENATRVIWWADSLKIALDFAGKCPLYKTILNKYKKQGEREIATTDLDQGEIAKDADVGPSLTDLNSHLTQYNEETNQVACTEGEEEIENYIPEAETEENTLLSKSPKLFKKTAFPNSTQSTVLEFLDVKIGTVRTKKFEIRNETPVFSNCRIRVRNFRPIRNRSKHKQTEECIGLIYRRVFANMRQEAEETLNRMKNPNLGLVVYVFPSKSPINPFEKTEIQLSIFADTWGTYMDEVIINISGLPKYTVGLYVQVLGSPISLPMPQDEAQEAYLLRFGAVKAGLRYTSRNVIVKNTSTLPVIINWHTFSVNSNEEMPFNIILDLCTPFTNNLAQYVRLQKDEAFLEAFAPFSNFKRTSSRLSISTVNETPSDASIYTFFDSEHSFNYDAIMKSDTKISFMSSDNVSHNNTNTTYIDASASDNYYKVRRKTILDDTELKMSIIPYYGQGNTETCVIHPKESIIPPKDSVSICVSVRPEKDSNIYTKQLACKILGIIRIAPMDKYRDYCHSREDGYFLSPVEINLLAEISLPRLSFDISKFERTFVFSATAVMEAPKEIMKMTKKYCFYNCDTDSMNIYLDIYDPFKIQCISTNVDGTPRECFNDIRIQGQSGIEVDVACLVTPTLVNILLNDDSHQDLTGSKLILKELLVITHSDKSNQTIEFILELVLPSFNLSAHTLDFGYVFVGGVKKMILTIQNTSVFKQNFVIKKKFENDDFIVHEEGGQIMNCCSGSSSYSITITFAPKQCGKSRECLQIVTPLPDYVEECTLCGDGSLDEKYYIPGI